MRRVRWEGHCKYSKLYVVQKHRLEANAATMTRTKQRTTLRAAGADLRPSSVRKSGIDRGEQVLCTNVLSQQRARSGINGFLFERFVRARSDDDGRNV